MQPCVTPGWINYLVPVTKNVKKRHSPGVLRTVSVTYLALCTLLHPTRPPSSFLYPSTVLIYGTIPACTHSPLLHSSSCRPQTHTDSCKASHMIVLKAYTLNCVLQCVWECEGKERVGVGTKGGIYGKQLLPRLSIFLSCLSDFSPWSFGRQRILIHHPLNEVIWFYKAYTNNSQEKKSVVQVFPFARQLHLAIGERGEVELWEISITCRGGRFNLAQKILRYNPFTLHCFCCSALYYAPIPLSFHLSYPPPPPPSPHHHTLKLQLSWSLSTDSQANTSG